MGAINLAGSALPFVFIICWCIWILQQFTTLWDTFCVSIWIIQYLILVTPFATNKDFYLHYYTHYFLFLFKKNVFFLPERFIDTELDPCALECAVLKCFVICSLLQSIKWVTCCYFYSSTFSYFTNNLKGWWQRVMYNITWDSNTYEILWVLQ